jgi:hypothetical protein
VALFQPADFSLPRASFKEVSVFRFQLLPLILRFPDT